MGMTLVQKIMSDHLGGHAMQPGDVVMWPRDVVLGNDASTNACISVLRDMHIERVFDPWKIPPLPHAIVLAGGLVLWIRAQLRGISSLQRSVDSPV